MNVCEWTKYIQRKEDAQIKHEQLADQLCPMPSNGVELPVAQQEQTSHNARNKTKIRLG